MPVTIDLTEAYTPTPKQALAHRAIEMFPLFGGAVGGGKSCWLCEESKQLSLDYPGNRGGIYRWENKTFKNTTYLTLQEHLQPELIARHHLSDQYYDLINGSRIYYGGLKPSGRTNPIDRLKSLELGWFGIDEANQIPEEVFLILASRLRLKLPGIRYKGLLTSNPEPGWLHRRFIQQNLPDHIFIPALPKDNPHLPPDYEERLRELFPEEWIARYLEGDWTIMLEGNFVFPYALVRAAMEREIEPEGYCEMGIDVGRGGDESVVAGRWGKHCQILHTSTYRNTAQTTGELAIVMDEHSPTAARIDAVGVGGPIYDRLKEQDYPVVEYIAGAAPNDPRRFMNKRAEDHWHFRDILEDGDADLPDDHKLSAQLCSIKYDIMSDKRIKIQSKEDMRRDGVKSPDRAEAVIQAYSENKATKIGRVYTSIRKRLIHRQGLARGNPPRIPEHDRRRQPTRTNRKKGRVIIV